MLLTTQWNLGPAEGAMSLTVGTICYTPHTHTHTHTHTHKMCVYIYMYADFRVFLHHLRI